MKFSTSMSPRSAALTLLLAAGTFASQAHSSVVSVYWTGTITGYFEFGVGALPTGVSVGSPITGELRFDTDEYSTASRILGSDTFGDVFRFGESLSLNIASGSQEWNILGSDIGLITNTSAGQQAFDVFGTSERHTAESFAGYVGAFEVAFALFAKATPFSIFDTSDLQSAIFDFERPTSASGFLSTRLLDENDDFVDGYYLDFSIHRSSSSPIPEPSISILLAFTAMSVVIRRYRNGEAEQVGAGDAEEAV